MYSVRVTGEAASSDAEGARKFVDTVDEKIRIRDICQCRYLMWMRPEARTHLHPQGSQNHAWI